MFDSTIKVLEMKNMPIPQTIHAIATGPTAEFSAIFWGVRQRRCRSSSSRQWMLAQASPTFVYYFFSRIDMHKLALIFFKS